jgi:hypothetical protein
MTVSKDSGCRFRAQMVTLFRVGGAGPEVVAVVAVAVAVAEAAAILAGGRKSMVKGRWAPTPNVNMSPKAGGGGGGAVAGMDASAVAAGMVGSSAADAVVVVVSEAIGCSSDELALGPSGREVGAGRANQEKMGMVAGRGRWGREKMLAGEVRRWRA